MKKIFKNYSLSITLFTIFLLCWLGQGIFQYTHEKDEAKSHNEELTTEQFTNSYLASTFENWQSEFLQLAAMVVFTSLLVHKGSPESKDSNEKMEKILRRIEKKVEGKKK